MPFLLKVLSDGERQVRRSGLDMHGARAWLFCWPRSMYVPKYALNMLCWWSLGCIPYLWSKFAAQDLSHVRLWRAAIEYHPASDSSQSGMPIFGWTHAFFCMKKRKSQTLLTALSWAATASCEVLLLRTLTVKHVASFLKSSYLWLRNYSLDMLLLYNMNPK